MAFVHDAARRNLQPAEAGRRNKKLTAFARWQKQGGYQSTCQVCQNIWKQVCRDLEEAHPFGRCEGCPALLLEPGNHTAWDVYERCWNQVIVAGMGQVIGIHIEAVYRVMESLDVPKSRHIEIIDKINLIHTVIFPGKKEGEK